MTHHRGQDRPPKPGKHFLRAANPSLIYSIPAAQQAVWVISRNLPAALSGSGKLVRRSRNAKRHVD